MGGRVFWIDAIRAVSMVFVLVNHSWGNSVWLQKFYTPFFLTSFFFVSGFVFARPNQDFCLKNKLLRLIESLIIPYFSYWIVSYFVLDVIVLRLGINGYLHHLVWSFKDGNKLWFISCLLLIELLMTFIFALSNKTSVRALISMMLLVGYFYFPSFRQEHSKWSVNVALFMQFFFMMGYVYRQYENKINKLCRDYYIPSIATIGFSVLYTYGLFSLQGCDSIASNRYSSYCFFIFMAVMGIITLVRVLKTIKGNFILSYIGSNTLLIYFFHKQLMDIAIAITSYLQMEKYILIAGVFQVVFVLLTVTVPVYVCNHYLKFMSGKSRWLTNLFSV